MESILRILFLSIILVLIDGEKGETSPQNTDFSKNQTLIDINVNKSDNKSKDLVTSDQHFSYSYIKDGEHSYGNPDYDKNGKSYLKEVHYFHDKEIGYERKHDWSSDNDKEIASKKTKKDLYNKRINGKNYDYEDMIEIKKWDDEEPNIHTNIFNGNYDQGNDNNYDRGNDNYNNYNENKSKTRLNTNINLNNDNNYKSDDNNDNNNYSQLKYGTGEESAEERGRGFSGYDEDNQKWFTNMEDKDQSGSTDNEVKDEDNYNNFNSPKFRVNFNSFKPWNKIMRNRRHGDNNYQNDKNSDNLQDKFEIYSQKQPSQEDTDSREDRFNYEPKLLTNLNIEPQNENKDKYNNNINNNNENYNKNKNKPKVKEIKYKTTDFKETVKKLRSRPKTMRYHYKKRVEPQTYSKSKPKGDTYRNGYESSLRDGDYPSVKTEMEKKFIEMPYDMFNTGWSSVQKPLRQRSNRKPVPIVRQYRYGF